MSVETGAGKVSAPLHVPWSPGMTEWASEPSFTPESFDEVRWVEVVLEPLAPHARPAGYGVVFGPGKMRILVIWIEARMHWIKARLGWELPPDRWELLRDYCLFAATINIDPRVIGRSPHWPHPGVNLRDLQSTTR